MSSSLVGTMGLQEDMVGPSQSDLECMKILLPRMYAETLVSAHFLCAESNLLGFAFGNELVPLSGYVDRCARRNRQLQWPRPSEVTGNSNCVWTTSRAWPSGRWRCSPTLITCTSVRDGSTSAVPSTSKSGSLLYYGMTASHRLTSRSSTLPPTRKQYPHDFEADGSQLSLPITELRSFAVILKKYHLKAKYW